MTETTDIRPYEIQTAYANWHSSLLERQKVEAFHKQQFLNMVSQFERNAPDWIKRLVNESPERRFYNFVYCIAYNDKHEMNFLKWGERTAVGEKSLKQAEQEINEFFAILGKKIHLTINSERYLVLFF